MLGAQPDDGCDFFCGNWKNDRVWKSRRVPRLAMAVVFANRIRGRDAIAEKGAEWR
jgi:hypothetical protein